MKEKLKVSCSRHAHPRASLRQSQPITSRYDWPIRANIYEAKAARALTHAMSCTVHRLAAVPWAISGYVTCANHG